MLIVSYLLYRAGKSSSQPITQYHLNTGKSDSRKGIEDIETDVVSSGSDEALLPPQGSTHLEKSLEFSPLHPTPK